MKLVKLIFRFYIHSSLHVALAVVSFMLLRIYEIGLTVNLNLIFCVFFATISGYNFVKYAGIAKLHHRSLTKQLRAIQIFSAISFVFTIYFLVQLRLMSIMLLISLSIINFIYAFPVFSKAKNLRNLPLVKIYIIAMVWSITCVFLPIIEYQVNFELDYIYMFLQQFLMVVVLMIPFEIRDLKYDLVKLQTLPQILGILNAKILAGILLIFITILSFYFFESNMIFSIVFSFFSFLLIAYSSKNQSLYYSSFYVESVPIFSFIFVCIEFCFY